MTAPAHPAPPAYKTLEDAIGGTPLVRLQRLAGAEGATRGHMKMVLKGKKVLEDVEEPSTGGKSNVIDLMAALKQSVGGKEKAKPTAKTPAKTRKRA